MLLGFLVLFLSVQAYHFIRIFNFGNAYRQRRTTRQAWTGAIIIGGWYWLGVLVLYFVQGLTVALVPGVNTLASSLIDILPQTLLNPILSPDQQEFCLQGVPRGVTETGQAWLEQAAGGRSIPGTIATRLDNRLPNPTASSGPHSDWTSSASRRCRPAGWCCRATDS